MDEPTVRQVPPPAGSGRDTAALFGARYRAVALLGAGGMGSVYLAHDDELDELVALKVVKPELASDASMMARFREEVRIARQVSSPLVARTHDLAEHDGRWFVTMQYVEGETLSTRLRRAGAMPLSEVLPIARDVCDGLSAVHAAGVLHRDLKPGNVLLSTSGRAVLTDFGIAIRAGSGATANDGSGTPTYMAPEQLAGERIDVRADVYSAGALLYVMATGKKPFTSRAGDEEAPDPRQAHPDVPDAFAEIVMRAMALNPAERFESSAALKRTLDGVRPGANARPHALADFVRSLGAALARRLYIDLEAAGAAPMLASVARADLMARLQSRADVRVVPIREDAEAVLAAKLAASGDRITLDLGLQSIGDALEFWHDTLEGPARSLPKLIEAAAHAIERAFSPGRAPLRAVQSYPSKEVADLAAEAREEYRKFWTPHVKRSIELFERALTLAPDHPLLLGWCAAAYSRLRFVAETPSIHTRDRDLAERAVALAPDLPEARVALASSYTQDMRFVDAVPHFVAALCIAPGLLDQRSAFARLLQECGVVTPALDLAQSTLDADPTFHDPVDVVARHHVFARRLDLAQEFVERSPVGRVAFVRLGMVRFSMWFRDRERFEANTKALDMQELDPAPQRLWDMWKRLLDRDRMAMTVLPVPNTTMRRRAFYHQLRAEGFLLAEDAPHAAEEIDKAVALGLVDIRWLDCCPLLDPLRGTVRFERLRQTVHARAIEVLEAVERSLTAA